MTALCFLGTETTSLHRPSSPTPGEVWEVGLIVRQPDGTETEHHWFLPVTLEHADPVSLDIGRFHDRHPQGYGYRGRDGTPFFTPFVFVEMLLRVIPEGAHLVGNVVSFDEERLAAILHRHGVERPPWHYHLVDVEALAAGWLAGARRGYHDAADVHGPPAEVMWAGTQTWAAMEGPAPAPPWDSSELCDAVGVAEPSDEDRHTALGDARWARDVYDAVMDGAS